MVQSLKDIVLLVQFTFMKVYILPLIALFLPYAGLLDVLSLCLSVSKNQAKHFFEIFDTKPRLNIFI